MPDSRCAARTPQLRNCRHFFFFFFHFDSIDSVLLFGRDCLALHSGKSYYQATPAKTCDLIQQQDFSAKDKLNNSFLHSPHVHHTQSQARLNPKWKGFENYLRNVWSKSLTRVSSIPSIPAHFRRKMSKLDTWKQPWGKDRRWPESRRGDSTKPELLTNAHSHFGLCRI